MKTLVSVERFPSSIPVMVFAVLGRYRLIWEIGKRIIAAVIVEMLKVMRRKDYLCLCLFSSPLSPLWNFYFYVLAL